MISAHKQIYDKFRATDANVDEDHGLVIEVHDLQYDLKIILHSLSLKSKYSYATATAA
jgi:xanthine/CO dehydrogenase XdhC/CoxF family maturation factor